MKKETTITIVMDDIDDDSAMNLYNNISSTISNEGIKAKRIDLDHNFDDGVIGIYEL